MAQAGPSSPPRPQRPHVKRALLIAFEYEHLATRLQDEELNLIGAHQDAFRVKDLLIGKHRVDREPKFEVRLY